MEDADAAGTESTSPPPPAAGMAEREEELVSTMLELATLCKENNISLPERIQHTLRSIEDPAATGQRTKQDGMGRRKSSCHRVLDKLRARYRTSVKGLVPLAQEVAEFQMKTKQSNIDVELRMNDVSYTVSTHGRRKAFDGTLHEEEERFDEEYANSPQLKGSGMSLSGIKKVKDEKVLLDGINLRFESGKIYLVLGAPGCGKSLLLKSIANMLWKDKNHVVGGKVSINGQTTENKLLYWPNLVAYVDQSDRHHAKLTVREALDFSFKCRARGTHRMSEMPTDDPEINELIRKVDDEKWRLDIILKGAGLKKVENTFIGDDSMVRGISGGERRRVTVSEMFTFHTPVICMDELSTGLDAATTLDIVNLLGNLVKFNRRIMIMSLLQPPPEVFALFDELILLDQGRIMYAGPVDEVVPYFRGLGYSLPDRMDAADWLQALMTPDGAQYLRVPDDSDQPPTHFSHEQFVAEFRSSERGLALIESLEAPPDEVAHEGIPLRREFTRRYQNSWQTSLKLCFKRELLLWRRNDRLWKMKAVHGVLSGVVTGTLFWQTKNPGAIFGVMFKALVFVALGNMPPAAAQLLTRGIFYKEQDANFYPTWTFVLARVLASFPTFILDSVVFGTLVFFFSGLGTSIANYFIFLFILLTTAFSCSLVYAIYSSICKTRPTMQAAMAVLIAVFIIFSGFTVQPDVIPDYWIWLHWMNLFAWAYRALAVNEFQSGKYDDTNPTGDQIMEQFGLVHNGEPFQFGWIWWGVLYLVGIGIIALIASTVILEKVRVSTSSGAASANTNDKSGESVNAATDEEDYDSFDLPFKRVDLTFTNIRYTAESSISKEPIELLKGVNGYIESGKMTALMGSSGAGKTTLMDVLALRKTSGEVEGVVKLNGHPQEAKSFRRCTGYVEQFDVQSPQLTIFETVKFSAKLRLDSGDDEDATPENIQKFINKTLHMLELTPIKDLLVGSDLSQGLSFEQKKRLSIAVELVSNPSIIFLDEPTTGLDARGASMVMRGLKNIAKTGRAICATIHQPSNAIFNGFDSLLLLKRGGETVFFGDLGTESCLLIEYLEQFEATSKIVPGENPATWMLKAIEAGSSGGASRFDYATSYHNSRQKISCLERIKEIEAQASDSNLVSYPSKYTKNKWAQSLAVYSRLNKIYWRSPSYNLSRVVVSAIIALMMGSLFAYEKAPTNESDMNSRVTSVFITAMFLGVTSFNTILPVFEVNRNIFYRHKATLMYDQTAINLAFTLAEIPFVLAACMVFVICFYFLIGFSTLAYKFFLFYLFTTLNMLTWTYLGQMTMSLFESNVAAQSMGSIFVGMATLFAGILIRPQLIGNFWIFMYWILPVQYVLHGIIASQFHDDDTKIEPFPGSDYSKALEGKCGNDKSCWASEGTAEFWIEASFGGMWAWDNIWHCVVYLIGVILGSRVITYIALMKLNYLSK